MRSKKQPALKGELPDQHVITDPTTLRILELHRQLTTIELELFEVKKQHESFVMWAEELEQWQESLLAAIQKSWPLIGILVASVRETAIEEKYLTNGKLGDWRES